MIDLYPFNCQIKKPTCFLRCSVLTMSRSTTLRFDSVFLLKFKAWKKNNVHYLKIKENTYIFRIRQRLIHVKRFDSDAEFVLHIPWISDDGLGVREAVPWFFVEVKGFVRQDESKGSWRFWLQMVELASVDPSADLSRSYRVALELLTWDYLEKIKR